MRPGQLLGETPRLITHNLSRFSLLNLKMKSAILATLVASAAAFVPSQEGSRTSVATQAAMDDLKAIAEKSNPVLKVSF